MLKVILFSTLTLALPAYALTMQESKNLTRIFECNNSVDYALLDKTMRKYGISGLADTYTLKGAITVFGLPVRKIKIFRDSGEDSYRAYTSGVSSQQMAKAAGLTSKQGGYSKMTNVGRLSIEDYEGLHYNCSVATGW